MTWRKHPTANFWMWDLADMDAYLQRDPDGVVHLQLSATTGPVHANASLRLDAALQRALAEALTTEPEDDE